MLENQLIDNFGPKLREFLSRLGGSVTRYLRNSIGCHRAVRMVVLEHLLTIELSDLILKLSGLNEGYATERPTDAPSFADGPSKVGMVHRSSIPCSSIGSFRYLDKQ